MNELLMSVAVDVLLIIAFIIDRIFRLRSISEYKDAKEAQLILLKQQLDAERSSNDVRITELHKQRYENLKLLLDEKELELNSAGAALLELQAALERNANKEKILGLLVNELNRVERSKLSDGIKKAMLLEQLA